MIHYELMWNGYPWGKWTDLDELVAEARRLRYDAYYRQFVVVKVESTKTDITNEVDI
jgi:hypothetical protein